MRIAIISDIHGNFPALQTVIADARKNGADEFIFLGDYIFDLPYPNEAAELLMGMNNAHIIAGNKETYLRTLSKQNQREWTDAQLGGMYQTYRELTRESFEFLTGLANEKYIRLKNGAVIYAAHFLKSLPSASKTIAGSLTFHKRMLEAPFSHGDYLEAYSALLDSGEYASEINETEADIILVGHNHLQGYCRVGDKLVINPGSCGLPLDCDTRAAYVILETDGTRHNVIEKRVAYDAEAVINYTKGTQLYAKGRIWSELVFLAMRKGLDYFGLMFESAEEIAQAKGEDTKGNFSDRTWEDAYAALLKRID